MARGGRADSAYVSWVKDKRHTELLRGSGSAPDHTWTSTRTLGLHPISRTGSLWLLLKSRVGTSTADSLQRLVLTLWLVFGAGRDGGDSAWKQRVRRESGPTAWGGTARTVNEEGEETSRLPASQASIRALVDRLAPGWQPAQNVAAAHELAELAQSRQARRRVVKAGAVQPLVALLARHNNSLLEPACACLSVLAQDDEGRRLMISAGAARPLVLALRSTRSAVLREASGALWNMSHKNDEGVQAICTARAIPALVEQLRSADEHVLINALSTLANIAATPSGRTSVGGGNLGAVPAATRSRLR